MRIRLAIPDRHVSAPVLDAALEATTRAAQAQQLSGEGPTFSDMMRAGVRWQPERFSDGEHFDLPRVVGDRGWGDCDDLAPAYAAELRQYDPGARARVVQSGPGRWHAVVQLSDGTVIDPSRMAGMRRPSGVHGAIARPMARLGESAMAISPYRGEWWARTDLPWEDGHLASISHNRDLSRALDQSIHGAITCGHGLCWPHSTHRQVLGDLFGDLVSTAAGLVPGGTVAVDLAKAAGIMPGGGGGAAPGGAAPGGAAQPSAIQLPHGGKAICSPTGPIIVRF